MTALLPSVRLPYYVLLAIEQLPDLPETTVYSFIIRGADTQLRHSLYIVTDLYGGRVQRTDHGVSP